MFAEAPSLVVTYPDSDMADQAKWMMDNMDKPLPDFDEIEEKVLGN